MSWELDPEHVEERDAIVAKIHLAFGGLQRGTNGVSWSEAVALDNYRSDDECLAARKAEKDGVWEELVNDPGWEPFAGIGGFSFINAEGFHYYLPATLVRVLQDGNTEWYPGHFLETIERFYDEVSWRDGELEAVAHFIAFMSKHDPWLFFEDEINVWELAIKNRWHRHLTGA